MHKRSESKLTIVACDYHRNGIGGVGFYAVIFDDPECGRMVASVFQEENSDEPSTSYCAVYKIDELAKGNVEFAKGNSWRGDDFAHRLRPLIKEHMEKKYAEQDKGL